MRAEVEPWVAYTLVQRARRIDPRPPYQRGPVWNEKKKQLLIDTMLRGYDFPKIYLRQLTDGGEYAHEVVDGQQRLRAIWDYFDDAFALGGVSRDLPGLGNLHGKRFSELSAEVKDTLGFFKVSVTVLTFDKDAPKTTVELQIRDLFLRLQEGDSLNPAEKRNAVMGPVRDYVRSLSESHRLFPSMGIADKRFLWDELAALALRLEMADGPADLKAVDLMRLYRDATFEKSGPTAQRCAQVLDYMAGVAAVRTGSLRTKWGFVDMYLAVRILLQRSPELLVGREEDVLNSHLKLESERMQAAGALDELLATDDEDEEVDELKLDLFNYTQAFTREGAIKRNVERRHNVYLKRLIADLASPGWSE